MLIQNLPNELNVRIDDGWTQWLRATETLGLDGVAHRVRMHAQFAGDGSDFPMLGVKVAANLRTNFGTDHETGSPSSWNAWKRIDETTHAATDPATQPQARPGLWPTGQ